MISYAWYLIQLIAFRLETFNNEINAASLVYQIRAKINIQ